MRKIVLALCVMLGIFMSASAQTKSITGRVTDSTGAPVPFATVKLQKANSGVIADNSGTFSIKAKPGDAIEVSSTGYALQHIIVDEKNVYTVVLKVGDQITLAEIVVTGAYNTRRTARSVSYNAQVVTSEQLNTIRQTNLNNALAGKVAGLQVQSQSVAKLGQAGSIRLRGASGIGTGESVIYVVDGTILPNSNDINTDDIENVTVLQGPAAAAQFGSQGANGAIVITTKRASKNQKGLGVDVNIGTQFDNVYIMPNYQNSYAGGSSADMLKYTWQPGQPEEWKALDGKYYHNYEDDASWGPRMLGQEYIPWYAWYGGTKYSYKTASLNPQPDNAKDFFNTGVLLNNSVAVSKATDATAVRFSYGNIYAKGLLPNSSLKKNTMTFNLTHNITPKLIMGLNLNYISQLVKGEIGNDADDYSNQSSGSFNQWFHRDLDMGIMKELRGLQTPGGIYASWNHQNPGSYKTGDERSFYPANYWYNFYTYFDLQDIESRRDRFYGNVSLAYKLTSDIEVRGTFRKQQANAWGEVKYSSDYLKSGTQTTGNNELLFGYYGTGQSFEDRTNVEFLASYNKKFNDFAVHANVGSDFFSWMYKDNGGNTNQGLIFPNLYTLTNSVNQASSYNNRFKEKYNALYGVADLGYKNFLFVNATLRNDWFSTLKSDDNNVLSKSFGASFVFSDLVKVPAISYGKLRVSWGEVPQALGTSFLPFGAYRYPSPVYGVGQFQWNGNALQSTPDQLVDSNLTGAVKRMIEYGIDMKFLKNRVGFSFTYWNGTEENFPTNVTINGANGFTSYLTNAGKLDKQGIDVQFNAIPFNSPNFRWELNATWAYLLKNTVVSVSNDTTIKKTVTLEAAWGATGPVLIQEAGQEWGQMYGNGMKRINGKPQLTSTGNYINDPNVHFGSVLPKYTGGVQNSFVIFKDFLVNVNIDYQVGGKFFSLSDMWGSYSGLTSRTATVNDLGNPIRDAVANGGGVHVYGVDADGKDVDYFVEAQDYYHNLYNNKIMDPYIYDLTFVKLRELSVGYEIPVQKLGIGNVVQGATFSLVARNPWLIYAQTKDFDPSELPDVGSESGQLPGTRGFGFNLKVRF
ncbi:MAG TPA: SusC/RagA family TonB-linked outer membrane protein [Parafilimonas sp.]|nr:SusC/RagA family TonB-linked outer membrane protein [Parafilimonas sp.]